MAQPAIASGAIPPIASDDEHVPFFDALLLTASNPSQADAFGHEIRLRQARGSLPPPSQCRVLVVCDPLGQRIGSGGATLAALEALMDTMPGNTREERVHALMQLKIGMFHSGGDSQRLPTCSVRGKAFCGLPAAESTSGSSGSDSFPAASAGVGVFESTPLDFLITRLARLQRCPGVIISATDCLLDFPPDYPPIRAGSPESQGVLGCTVRTPRALGSAHGVFVVAPDVLAQAGGAQACAVLPVSNIIQKGTQSELEQAGAIDPVTQTLLLDAGNIFLCPRAVEALLKLAVVAPFDSCCQVPKGVAATASGATAAAAVASKAFRFELYTDILLPLNPSLTLSDYLASAPPDPSCPPAVLASARRLLWDSLNPFACFVALHPRAAFYHMGTMAERMDFMFAPQGMSDTIDALRRDTGFTKQAQAAFDAKEVQHASEEAAVLNALMQTRPDEEGTGIDAPPSHPAVTQAATGASDDDDADGSVRLCPGSFVEYSHLRGRFHLAPGAMVSGVRSRAIATDLRVGRGVVVQETQCHEGWGQVLGVTSDGIEYAPPASHGSQSPPLSAPPPTIVSIFHTHDSIKTPYTSPQASFLTIPFQAFIKSVARRIEPDTSMAVEQVVRQVWPKAQTDAQRTLWSARLFPIFHADEAAGTPHVLPRFYPFNSDAQLSLWLLSLRAGGTDGEGIGYPSAAVLSAWLAAPRASFSDILACADGAAETLWRERLSVRVDRARLQQHLFENAWRQTAQPQPGVSSPIAAPPPHSHLLSALLARSQTAHTHYPTLHLLAPLLHALDVWGTRCTARLDRLDVAMRVCWLQARLLALLFPFPPSQLPGAVAATDAAHANTELDDAALSVALQQHPQLAALRAQVTRCDSDSFRRVLPWALAVLAASRAALFPTSGAAVLKDAPALAAVLRALYTLVGAAASRVGVARPADVSFTAGESGLLVRPGQRVLLEGSLRVDLFGGWTDTPPVCWEQPEGGAVVNVAISVGGQLPLKTVGVVDVRPAAAADADAAAPDEPCIIVEFTDPACTDAAELSSYPARVSLSTLAQLNDYGDPSAPAALLKCVLLAMGIVRLSPLDGQVGASSSPAVPELQQQLTAAYWRGKPAEMRQQYGDGPIRLQVRSWVALGAVSQGTGLGVSSLLAANLVLLLARLFDRHYSPESVTYIVLRAEQLLTTGGGSQDQVGGLWPGVKLARSSPGLPLKLSVEQLPIPAATLAAFSQRLLLVHTGMPRLARNLLRTVLDHWATRQEDLVNMFRTLSRKAPQMGEAIAAAQWERVGQLLSEYWQIKRRLATPHAVAGGPPVVPAEPAHVTAFLQRVQPLVHGASLVGAGGGGFLVLIAEPEQHAAIGAQVELFNQHMQAGVPYRLWEAAVCGEEGSQVCIRVEA